ncbi:MAG: carboxypeptidase M32 [Alphaproteobacteria bacterium]|nr:carboxypeptidase M32 [Alphaproteobacteria bacterium]
MNTETAWTRLQERTRELEDIYGVMSLLEWDQQTMMPSAGAAARGRQLGFVSGVYHEKASDPALGELFDALRASEDPLQRAAARNLERTWDRAVRLPPELVKARAQARVKAHHAWMQAREAEDFKPFVPALSDLIAIVREEIAALRTDQADPYDVLLEPYDPGSTVATLEPMFERLAAGSRDLLSRLEGRPHPAPVEITVPVEAQEALARDVVTAMGFDLTTAGRLDAAQHPFTVGIHPQDVRLTQHLYPDALLSGLTGTIHEAGHGLYEQGLPLELFGTGAGKPASFGLHESQSRLWENFIARSLPFCRWLVTRLDARVPGHGLTPEQLFGAANKVTPSFIRVFADEVTYNLHIIVRYRLERALFSDQLQVEDLAEAWDAGYERELGIRPERPTQGVLQDVHWSAALFAYFPSYTLGNLYAASLSAQLVEDVPGLWEDVARGDFSGCLSWLREKVHHQAHLQDAPDILRDALGERDHVADLLAHFEARQGGVYGL